MDWAPENSCVHVNCGVTAAVYQMHQATLQATHFVLKTTLWERYYYSLHFMDKETESQKGKPLPKVTEPLLLTHASPDDGLQFQQPSCPATSFSQLPLAQPPPHPPSLPSRASGCSEKRGPRAGAAWAPGHGGLLPGCTDVCPGHLSRAVLRPYHTPGRQEPSWETLFQGIKQI